ncbi:ricin-type beta-trefoil lectin domain protein [Streptomyces olivaceoviridis]
MPTESATKPPVPKGTPDGRKEPTGSKTKDPRKAPSLQPVEEGAETEAESGTRPRTDSREAETRPTTGVAASSPLSLLSPRASRRRTGTTAAETVTPSGTPATATAEGEDGADRSRRDPDVLVSAKADPDTGGAAAGEAAGEAAGVAEGSTRTEAAGRGARALLRGSHRTLLTVAAVTGVVLVAGVLVGLRSGGGGGHDRAAPDPAATLLDPATDGGPQAGVPGALPVPSAHKSGAADGHASTGHGDPSPAGHGKHAGTSASGGGSHGSSSGSSASQSHGKTGGGSTSSTATHPATHATEAPAAPSHTKAPSTSGSSGGSGGSGGSGVMVFSHASGRCLTVAGGQGKDGSPLEIRDCSGSAAQKWTFASDGTIRAFGLCMDAAGASTSNGTVVQLANCNGGPAQQFRLNFRQDLTSVLADKCVDVKDQRTANGTRLQLWDCAGTDNQKWSKK